jgi:formylglycine-generating enzyme required for sulfatase activity
MSGNVLEWCMDWYVSNAYTGYKVGNLTPPLSGDCRVLRGGSWSDAVDSFGFRCADRNLTDPSDRIGLIGFRCARTI